MNQDNNRNNLIDPKEELITAAFLDHSLPLGHWGLHNSDVDCYLNSALQTLRIVVKNLSQQEQQSLLSQLRTSYHNNLFEDQVRNPIYALGSPLAAFLENKFYGGEEHGAAFLRQEIQDLMLRNQDISQAAKEIKYSIDSARGTSLNQGDASVALMALMECLQLPRARFREEDTYAHTGATRNTDAQNSNIPGDLIIPLSLSTACSIHELISSNFSSEISGVAGPNNSRNNFIRKKFLTTPPAFITFSLSRFRMKPDPQGGLAKDSKGVDIIGKPKLFLNAQGNPVPEKLNTRITDILSDIVLPLVSNNAVTQQYALYTPSAIICHNSGISANSGHYVTFVHEGNNWYLINDDKVTLIDNFNQVISQKSDSPFTLKNFIEENAYLISYRHLR